jgi:Bacterial Ig domain/Chitobiase/beta-hexosaminidase C-terminal domain
VIRYTTDGSDPTAASTAYTGPFTVLQSSTVKYRAWDNAGNVEATNSQVINVDSTPPTSSITCNGAPCSTGWYGGSVLVSLSAVDADSGVGIIRYTTDGSTPTATSTAYVGAFTVLQTTTVKYRAWDNAGNVEPTNSKAINIDSTPPTSSITCNSAPCSTGWYTAAVKVTILSTDSGSGVAAIRYTTDGSDPTTASPLYTAPFSVSQTSTLKYRAWDSVGNIESTKSQTIRLDTLAPTVAITSPAAGSTVTGTVKISASATDGGSGVASVKFYVDSQLISTVTALPYRDNWNTKKVSKGQHTLTAVAVDAAGNATASAPVTVTVN